jgi:hypothetical protein
MYQSSNQNGRSARIPRVSRFSGWVFRVLDPVFLLVVLGLSLALTGAALYRFLEQQQARTFRVAAGSETGESFVLAQALAQVIADDPEFPNVTFEVVETGGTIESLELLEAGEVDFAAAQADLIFDRPLTRARGVALLFSDAFHLLVRDAQVQSFGDLLDRLYDPTVKEIVYAPARGGQRESFVFVAAHFGLLTDVHYEFRDEDPLKNPDGPCAGDFESDIIFRVRVPGNEDIRRGVLSCWRLLTIEQAEALGTRNAALQPGSIPQGVYQGDTGLPGLDPVPSEPIATVAVPRLLLARDDVPEAMVRKVAAILNQDSQRMIDALRTSGAVREIPLAAKIAQLNTAERVDTMGVMLHPGAYQYYKPNESWFARLNENIDLLGLLLTIVPSAVAFLWGFNRWLRKRRKNTADTYLREANFLKSFRLVGGATRKLDQREGDVGQYLQRLGEKWMRYKALRESIMLRELPPDRARLDDRLVDSLFDEMCRLDRLNDVFSEASRALEREQISEESFRTFNESYASARESIEDQIGQHRRQIASYYVTQTMKLLDRQITTTATLDDLNAVRDEAAKVLLNDGIFSRESFRTFIEVYNLVKEGIEAPAREPARQR